MTSYETHLALAQERHDATLAPDPISPDCEQGKHRACSGDAWDDRTDEPADCTCDCHAVTEQGTAAPSCSEDAHDTQEDL